MKTFNISLEIELDAENSLEAAKKFEKWLQEPDNHFQYYVQDQKTKDIDSVDLDEDDCDAVLPVKNYTPIIS